MMLHMPANLAEVADPARVGGAKKPAQAGEFPGEWGDLLGLLLAAEPVEAAPGLAPAAGQVALEGAPAPLPGTPEELARTLFAALQAGKVLPPGGEPLPLASQLPGQPGALPAGALPATAAQPAESPVEAMARMLDLLRTLQGAAHQAAGGDVPVLQRAELKLLDSTEAGRLLLAATPPTANAAATTAASLAATGLAAAGSPAPAAGTAATPPSLPITTAPDQPGWDQAVGQRVLWMVANKSQVAELRLSPPELGPLEVKVRQDDDGLRLTFAAGNGAVREALEAAAPRLREMFQAEGLRLENLDIGQRQADGERAGEPAEAGNGDGALAEETEAEAGAAARVARVTTVGLVDLFV